MNALAGRLNMLVWHRQWQRWGHYVGPDADDPASVCFVQFTPGEDPVREDVANLMLADDPSAGQVSDPGPDTIEVRTGQRGETEPTAVLYYAPGRRVENRRPEAFSITQKLVGAGLAWWAEAYYGAAEPAYTERGPR